MTASTVHDSHAVFTHLMMISTLLAHRQHGTQPAGTFLPIVVLNTVEGIRHYPITADTLTASVKS